jgi:hypothetical protein
MHGGISAQLAARASQLHPSLQAIPAIPARFGEIHLAFSGSGKLASHRYNQGHE